MTPRSIPCLPPDAALFAPYGTFITPPARAGGRAYFSDHLGDGTLGAPVLHVNRIEPTALPYTLSVVERHPRADQVFIPLDVARYVVVVMPSDTAGNPDPRRALGFLVPGTMGVIYHARVWHGGATVLDRTGSFSVLMWRQGDDADDEFRTIGGIEVTADAPRPRHAVLQTAGK